MTNTDKVLSTLSVAELCDDCLSTASGVKPRQTVYAICTKLFEAHTIIRHHGKCNHCRKAKLVNRACDTQQSRTETAAPDKPPLSEGRGTDAWYWEGNVQARVVSYLAYNGYKIQNVANTAPREPGKDILAVTPDGCELWVSVKGYPRKVPTCKPAIGSLGRFSTCCFTKARIPAQNSLWLSLRAS